MALTRLRRGKKTDFSSKYEVKEGAGTFAVIVLVALKDPDDHANWDLPRYLAMKRLKSRVPRKRETTCGLRQSDRHWSGMDSVPAGEQKVLSSTLSRGY